MSHPRTYVREPRPAACCCSSPHVGAMYFRQESITAQKIVGLTLLLTGIILLRPS